MKSKLNKIFSTLSILVLCFGMSITLSPTAYAGSRPDGLFFFEPESYVFSVDNMTVGGRFNATVKVRNVTDMFAWQVKVYFNNTLLNCTNIWYAPDEPISKGMYMPVPPSIENDKGYVLHAITSLVMPPAGVDVPEEDPKGLCTIEFEVIKAAPPIGYVECFLHLDDKGLTKWEDSVGKKYVPPELSLQDGYFKYGAPPPPKPWLSVDPQEYTASSVGEVFGVNVTIHDLAEPLRLVGAEFRLTFNASVLRAIGQENGTFLEQFVNGGEQGVYYTFHEDLGDPVYGDNAVVGLLLLPDENGTWHAPFPEGNGTLCTILFNATATPPAECEIELVDTKMLDVEDNEIEHDVKDGIVHVRISAVTTDLNGDGIVDVSDIAVAARAFGTYPGHPRWDARADINGDGQVCIHDLWMVAKDFGKTF